MKKIFAEFDFEGLSRSFGRFGLYLYDGSHACEDQYEGIRAAQPALARQYVQIVDDWNWDQVRTGPIKAIASLGLQIDFMAEIRTTLDGTYPALNCAASDWHNGYCISVLSHAS